MNTIIIYTMVFADWLEIIVHDAVSKSAGIVLILLGYFSPLKEVINLVILLFVLDTLFGFMAAKKLRKEHFSKAKIFHTTIPRLFYSLIILMLLYMWDTTFSQTIVSSYKLVGWFLSGVLLASILKNIYKLTNWGFIPKIGIIVNDNIEKHTGVDIGDDLQNDLQNGPPKINT